MASLDGMEVIDAWVAATPPDVTQAAAYLTLRNTGAGDRLLSASSPRAAEVTLHRSAGDEDIASMRATGPIDLPSGSTFSFTPGDRHIMLSVIDAPFVEGEDNSLLDVLVNDDAPIADRALMNESLAKEIDRALATLTERECEIIKMFFGIGSQEMTLEEIGDKFGLTRERVRQIKEKAIRRLRQGTRSKLLKSYLG